MFLYSGVFLSAVPLNVRLSFFLPLFVVYIICRSICAASEINDSPIASFSAKRCGLVFVFQELDLKPLVSYVQTDILPPICYCVISVAASSFLHFGFELSYTTGIDLRNSFSASESCFS